MDSNLEVKIKICVAGSVLSADRIKILLEENKNNCKF